MLREEIKNRLVEAMKNKDMVACATLRMINSKIKDKDIELRPSGRTDGANDGEIMALLQTMIKQRKESVEMYRQGNREDLIQKEQGEIDLIASFLPKQMSEDEIKNAIVEIVAQTGASGIKDMGKVMGALKAKYNGQMDFGVASGLIKGMLS